MLPIRRVLVRTLIPFAILLLLTLNNSWASLSSSASCYDKSDVVLLLHTDGADASTTIVDEAGHTMTAQGNSQLDTDIKKLGSASYLLDGTGDYASTPNTSDWDFGTGNFTIDFWYWTDSTNGQNLMGTGYDTGWSIFWDTTVDHIQLYFENVKVYDVAWTPTLETWYHVAVVRNGTDLRVYINGTSLGSATDSTNIDASGELEIGRDTGTSAGLRGRIDEVRITKAAIWTGNFTAPSIAYVGCKYKQQEIE